MKDTRSTDKQANSWCTCEIPISTGSISASLLISESNEPNAQVDSFFRNVNHGNAHQTEDDGHSKITECHGDDVCAGR